MKKRILSILMALSLMIGLLPVSTLAAETSGNCGVSGTDGDNLTWSFHEATGALTIEGTGDMKQFGREGTVPWRSFRDSIVSVSLPEGLTSIGAYAFYGCEKLQTIQIPDTVYLIGRSAFQNSGLTKITIPDSVGNIQPNLFAGTRLATAGPVGGGYDIEFYWQDSIPQNAFYGCDSLTSITFPEGVREIKNDAFYNCTSLKEVVIPTV